MWPFINKKQNREQRIEFFAKGLVSELDKEFDNENHGVKMITVWWDYDHQEKRKIQVDFNEQEICFETDCVNLNFKK